MHVIKSELRLKTASFVLSLFFDIFHNFDFITDTQLLATFICGLKFLENHFRLTALIRFLVVYSI